MKARRIKNLTFIAFLTLSISCAGEPESEPAAAPAASPMPDVLALPEMAAPADNPITAGKVELGKQLFFDKRLSNNGQMSCETCHLPELGWTDGKALSEKFDGSLNTRHTPTLLNVAYYREWYWDGRSPTVEAQTLAAWRGQMGADPEQIAAKLNAIEGYRTAFMEHMGGPATPETIVKALTTFLRTLTSDRSPWDRYETGEKDAVSPDVIAGFEVFSHSDKANCTLCHVPPLYTDTLYHNTGVGYGKPNPDPGRGKILADQAKAAGAPNPEAEKLMGAFKTPTLRSITETKPYFHDGSAATLEEAVDFMLAGGVKNPALDEKLQPRKITEDQRRQLLAFLRSLTPPTQLFERPLLPQ